MIDTQYEKLLMDKIYAIDVFASGYLSINLSYHDGCVEIENFYSEKERNKGYGTKGFQAVLDIIDEYGFDVKLDVQPLRYELRLNNYQNDELKRLSDLNNKALNKKQLIDWYSKFGFDIYDYVGCKMIRKTPVYTSNFSM